MKNLIILSVFITIMLQSCITFVSGNEYNGLTNQAKERIAPFSLENWERRVDHSEYLDICEINSRDIKALAKHHPYLWIHLWNPYCSNDYCQNISYLETMANKYAEQGLVLVLVSTTYDLSGIHKIATESRFTRPIATMEHDYYGKNLKAARFKLEHDLTWVSKEVFKDRYRASPDDFFFKDGELLADCVDLTTQELDSLMEAP